jgi:ABC-type transport system substrate-binding protein
MVRRATALVTLLVLAVAGCSSSSEPSATSSSEPRATFTGSACEYSGPSEFDVNTTWFFKFTNDSDVTNMGFAVMNLEVDDEDAALDGTSPPTPVGASRLFSVTFVETGRHGVACYVLPGPGETETQRYITEFNVTE